MLIRLRPILSTIQLKIFFFTSLSLSLSLSRSLSLLRSLSFLSPFFREGKGGGVWSGGVVVGPVGFLVRCGWGLVGFVLVWGCLPGYPSLPGRPCFSGLVMALVFILVVAICRSSRCALDRCVLFRLLCCFAPWYSGHRILVLAHFLSLFWTLYGSIFWSLHPLF